MIQCPRCLKQCPDEYAVHTCNPTPLWRELEIERDELREQVAVMTEALEKFPYVTSLGEMVEISFAALAKAKEVK